MAKNYKNESQWSIIARELMELIVYDNNMVVERESWRKYKRKIQRECEKVFSLHPDFATDEWLENFAIGEATEKEELVKQYPELKRLDDLLNEFFNEA